MHHSGISGGRWVHSAWLVLACAIVSPGVYGQGRDMGHGYCSAHGNYTGSSCPSCSSSGDGGTGPYQGPNLWNILRERREQEVEKARQQRLDEAWQANHQAIEFQNKGDWSKAIALFEEAARKSPDDPVIRQNLAHAQTRLAGEKGLAFYEKGDWASAVASFREAVNRNPYEKNREVYQSNLDAAERALQAQLAQEQTDRQEKVAAANMQQAINRFALTLAAAPGSSGGLDFGIPAAGTGSLDFISTSPASGSGGPAVLAFGDPMVVDARNAPDALPEERMRDAVADAPNSSASIVPTGAIDLGRLERDLKKQLGEATDPGVKARLHAQLAWALKEKGDTDGAIEAINEASQLDPASSMLKLITTAAFADSKDAYADTIHAAKALLESDPGNRVAAGILAAADARLRKAIGAPAPASGPTVPLVPFDQRAYVPPAVLGGSPEEDKDRAERDFVFQGFGRQSHQPHWHTPLAVDQRISLEKHPQLKQSLAKRETLIAESRTAEPDKVEEIKQAVERLDKETEAQVQEILKKDFGEAVDL